MKKKRFASFFYCFMNFLTHDEGHLFLHRIYYNTFVVGAWWLKLIAWEDDQIGWQFEWVFPYKFQKGHFSWSRIDKFLVSMNGETHCPTMFRPLPSFLTMEEHMKVQGTSNSRRCGWNLGALSAELNNGRLLINSMELPTTSWHANWRNWKKT